MSEFQISNSKLTVEVSTKTWTETRLTRITVSVYDSKKCIDYIELPLSTKHYNKLRDYKRVNALIAYANKNRINSSQELSSSPCPAPVPVPAESAQGQGILIAECDQTINSESVSNTSLGDDPIHCHQDTLFIDVETTGLSYKDEIVEIAIVDIDENVLFHSLVKPSKSIPTEATAVHHITNSMVFNAPTFSEIWNDFLTLVQGKTLVFYNRAFDTRMIYQSAIEAFGKPELRLGDVIPFDSLFSPKLRPKYSCLMLDYAAYWGEWSDWHGSYKWQTLIKACQQQKISWRDTQNHRALGDAIKTARLYKVLSNPKISKNSFNNYSHSKLGL